MRTKDLKREIRRHNRLANAAFEAAKTRQLAVQCAPGKAAPCPRVPVIRQYHASQKRACMLGGAERALELRLYSPHRTSTPSNPEADSADAADQAAGDDTEDTAEMFGSKRSAYACTVAAQDAAATKDVLMQLLTDRKARLLDRLILRIVTPPAEARNPLWKPFYHSISHKELRRKLARLLEMSKQLDAVRDTVNRDLVARAGTCDEAELDDAVRRNPHCLDAVARGLEDLRAVRRLSDMTWTLKRTIVCSIAACAPRISAYIFAPVDDVREAEDGAPPVTTGEVVQRLSRQTLPQLFNDTNIEKRTPLRECVQGLAMAVETKVFDIYLPQWLCLCTRTILRQCASDDLPPPDLQQ